MISFFWCNSCFESKKSLHSTEYSTDFVVFVSIVTMKPNFFFHVFSHQPFHRERVSNNLCVSVSIQWFQFMPMTTMVNRMLMHISKSNIISFSIWFSGLLHFGVCSNIQCAPSRTNYIAINHVSLCGKILFLFFFSLRFGARNRKKNWENTFSVSILWQSRIIFIFKHTINVWGCVFIILLILSHAMT